MPLGVSKPCHNDGNQWEQEPKKCHTSQMLMLKSLKRIMLGYKP